jgi:hypothetical protein
MTRVMREFHRPEIRHENLAEGHVRLTTLRVINDALTHVRVTNALFPYTFVIPLSETITITQLHVPVDDGSTYWYSFFTSYDQPLDKEEMRRQRLDAWTCPTTCRRRAATTTGASTRPSSARAPTWAWAKATSTCTTSGRWKAWAPSRTARASTWAPATRSSWPTGALLQAAIDTVAAGGHPRWPGPTHRAPAAPTPSTASRRRRAGSVLAGAGAAKREAAPWRQGGDRRGRVLSSFARPAACTTRGARRPARSCCSAAEHGVEQVRIGWCDLHGMLRGKTLMPAALPSALRDGVGMVSTLLLKDTSDRTVFKVFEAATQDELPGFGQAGNLLLLPDPDSLVLLPWAPGTAWLRAQPWFADGTPVPVDPRRGAAACAGPAGRGRLRAAVRAGGRVPHLPHHRRTAGPGRRRLAG